MKLWKISQNTNNDYDTFDSAVVAAKTESDARATHPLGDGSAVPTGEGVTDTESCLAPWTGQGNVVVEYVGTAKPGTEAGVIVASFNAG